MLHRGLMRQVKDIWIFSFKILSYSGGRANLPLKATPIGVKVKIRHHFENTDTFLGL